MAKFNNDPECSNKITKLTFYLLFHFLLSNFNFWTTKAKPERNSKINYSILVEHSLAYSDENKEENDKVRGTNRINLSSNFLLILTESSNLPPKKFYCIGSWCSLIQTKPQKSRIWIFFLFLQPRSLNWKMANTQAEVLVTYTLKWSEAKHTLLHLDA